MANHTSDYVKKIAKGVEKEIKDIPVKNYDNYIKDASPVKTRKEQE